MTEAPIDADRQVVERERAELREFIKGLSPDDIRSGSWFTKLTAQALNSYTSKVDWQYFQERCQGVPADAVVDQRVKMAARYAALEGGLSASAYTAAVAATIGSLGGASQATVPAAAATMMVDVAFITRLQLHLAHDIERPGSQREHNQGGPVTILAQYETHYNGRRPHRSRQLHPPRPPCCRPFPGTDPAPRRPRRPHQRVRASCVKSQVIPVAEFWSPTSQQPFMLRLGSQASSYRRMPVTPTPHTRC
jgi:hypothetical protein